MRAVVLHEFGPADNLRYETMPDPVPGPGEVLVSVRAAGVHQIETALREGLRIGPPPPQLPAVFGGEVAGVVESVGPDVDTAWVGARVVTSHGRPGGYAELAAADVASLHRIPAGLGYEAAVTMVVTAPPPSACSTSRSSPPTTSFWSRPPPVGSAVWSSSSPSASAPR